MKKLVALLAMMTMLIGCGCSNTSDDQNKDDADNTVTDSQNDQNDTMDNSIGNDADRVGDDIVDGVDDAGNAIKDGAEDVGDALTGHDNTNHHGAAVDNGTGVTTSPNP